MFTENDEDTNETLIEYNEYNNLPDTDEDDVLIAVQALGNMRNRAVNTSNNSQFHINPPCSISSMYFISSYRFGQHPNI